MDDRLKTTLAAILAVEPSMIGENTSPETLHQWDSVKHMDIMLAIEEEFGVRFGDDQLTSLTSFSKIRAAVIALGGR